MIKSNHSFNSSMTAYTEVPGGRNRRSVWTIPTEPTPFAHFATFPRKLIEPMILAGCPERVCAVCGAPWVRVSEVGEPVLAPGVWSAKGTIDSLGRPVAEGSTLKHIREHRTLGFRPTCDHSATTRPGITLDPFMGSGTVALVARSLGRDFLGCDLSQEYVDLCNERLSEPYTLPLSSAPIQEPSEEAEQLTLW